jgi:hypothetical protein
MDPSPLRRAAGTQAPSGGLETRGETRSCRAVTSLPNLIVIGAQKCGTTSLHYYLNLHPEISMSRRKELDFFFADPPFGRWDRGIGWYKGQFDGGAEIRGEASPNYTSYPLFAGVPERMASVVPEAKLIYVVGDPIERIISHYVHSYAAGRENRPIEEALRHDEAGYFCRSSYYAQLERFLRHFPASNILITTRRELLEQRAETLVGIFRFLGVADDFVSHRFRRRLHRSALKRRNTRVGAWLSKRVPDRLSADPRFWIDRLVTYPFSKPVVRPVLAPDLRAELVERLRPDIDQLRDFCGRPFSDWSV